jgi:hypothetical protein
LIGYSVWQLSCWLDNCEIRIWLPAGSRGFSLLYSVHTISGAHPASYPMGTWGGGSFHGVK